MGNDINQPIYELFGPPLRVEQKIRELTLFNPWTRMYLLYRFDLHGFKHFRTFGPLGVRDSKRIQKAYKDGK